MRISVSSPAKDRQRSSWSPEAPSRRKTNWATFSSLLFSPNGGTLYFSSAGWATSPAAHAVDVTTGEERFLTDGVIVATLERGPYKGMLLAVHFRIDPEHNRGRHEMWEIMTPEGKTVRGLPESERARQRAIGGK